MSWIVLSTLCQQETPPPCSPHLGRPEFRGWSLPGQLGGWKLDITSHAWFFLPRRQVLISSWALCPHSTVMTEMMGCEWSMQRKSPSLSPLFLHLIFFLQMGWGGIAEHLLISLCSAGPGNTEKDTISFYSLPPHPQQGASDERQLDRSSVEVFWQKGNDPLAKGTTVYLWAGLLFILHKSSPSPVGANADNNLLLLLLLLLMWTQTPEQEREH